jgi:putative membrane-bound dehydrogenase-like protein
MTNPFRLTILTILLPIVASAADTFPTPYNSEPDKTASPPSAEEALKMFDLPEGFTTTLFASEPEVQNPIAMTWDSRGRLWVAENYTYAESKKRFDLDLRDRVLILEDTDHDGKADKRTVFTEKVQTLTSIEVGRGGVWLMCPPQLLFIPDANGDDIPDGEPEVILDGFTIAEANYHNFANGLRWGPDSWLYGRCGHSCPGKVGVPGTPEKKRTPIEGGIWRYHPDRKVFEGISHGTTNPWGHDWDRHGELFFINTVNGHLWHGIPGAHFKESFGADPNPVIYERLDMHADHWHFDTTGKWSDSRNGAADQFGGGHAHIGMMIYQGNSWPDRFHNRLFTLNMHGFRTNVERLDRAGSGYAGRHEPDIFLTKDKWFRGIDIRPGPDGAVYLLDWSDTGECHEHTGVHRTSGRIYRIGYGEKFTPSLFDPSLPAEFLNTALNTPDPWLDRQVRTLLPGHPKKAELEAFFSRKLTEDQDPVARLRTIWNLYALGAAADWSTFLKDDNEHLRSWAIRLMTDDRVIDTVLGPNPDNPPAPLPVEILNSFVSLAKSDPSGLVRLTLASTLQRLSVEQRSVLGAALAARDEDAGDHNLPSMVWFGISPLAKSDPLSLVQIAGESHWPTLLRWIGRSISTEMTTSPEPLDELLITASKLDPEFAQSLLTGISDGLQGWSKATKPKSWDTWVAAQTKMNDAPLAALTRELSVLFGDGRALDEIEALVLDEKADPGIRKAALETLISGRPDSLRKVCESLLDNRLLNATAVKGIALFDDPNLGEVLAKKYKRFSPEDRPGLIEVLVSRPLWGKSLLDGIAGGTIPKSDLSAFHARQINSFDDKALSETLVKVWGEARESDEAKRSLIAEWTGKLTPAAMESTDLSRGRLLFSSICGACHVMYGEGGRIGPDLTGSDRSDLGFLLENIIDPGAVVGADFRMTILTLSDGRVLTGVVGGETEKTLTLRQAASEMTVQKSELSKREVLPVSMMPEGLLLAFDESQVRDLIAYLRHPVQVALP